MRDYLNEGGKVLYTGQYAGGLEYTASPGPALRPDGANEQCVTPQPAPDPPIVLARCSGDLGQDDLLQYWFGAYLTAPTPEPTRRRASRSASTGSASRSTGLSWGFNGADSAQNQFHASSFITTSGILLMPDVYPQFESDAPAT